MDVSESENSDDESALVSDSESDVAKKPIAGRDNESSGESDDDDKATFVNPLAMANKKKAAKIEGELSEGEWSDESGENVRTKKAQAAKKKEKTLGKRGAKDREEDDAAKDFFGSSTFQEVPAEEIGARGNDASLDSTEIAETRILAKKMLRKKDRSELLDATFNRYSFHERREELPTWFVEDEQKSYFRRHQPTKEEIAIEKEEIKAYNARPSKKVEEAKARKKKRLVKAM